MEIQAVVEHEPPDEWVERKTQSTEEVGKEHYPLMWPWGGEALPLFWKPVPMSLDKYPAFLSFFMCPSMTEETIHLPPAPDMTGEGRGGSEDLGAGARVRENG